MSELKATPGPWHVEHDGRFADVVDDFGDCISACIPLDAANFVAAAPEMSEALDLLVKEIERIDDNLRVRLEDHEPDLVSLKDHAKGVLEKARGEK